MKKIISLLLILFLIPINIKAISVKETTIDCKSEVNNNEMFDVKVKINFDEFDKKNENSEGISLVYYELMFDDEVLGINDVNNNEWNTKIYRDKENKYYAISELSKNDSDNKCKDKKLYCGDYEVSFSFYGKKKSNETEIKIGDVIIGILPVVDSKKELTEEDVTFINVSGKSSKVISIKDSKNDKIDDINDIVIVKDKVEVTKEMVLESKDAKYSVEEKDNYIEKLEIMDYDLKFRKYVNDYVLKVKDNVKTLGIKVELSNKNASYEIKGNDNLSDNSEIDIEVKALNGEINNYKIKIIKEKEEKIEKKEEEKSFLGIKVDVKNLDYKLIGIIVASILGLIIIIKIIMKLHDRKLEKAIKKL